MRRLMTCALSFVFALSFIGQASATNKESAPSGLGFMAPADNLGQDPIVPVPLAPSPASSGTPMTPVTSANTIVRSPIDQLALAGDSAPSVLRSEAGTSISLLPDSPISDLLMWSGARRASPRVSPTIQRRGGLRRFTAGIIDRTRLIVARITDSAMHFIGTPYAFGGTTAASGFDCSGYVQRVYKLVGVNLPRTADAQYQIGKHIDTAHAKRGDLVFFRTYAPGASHVGIYLGHDEFIHSSSHGVMVSSLHEAYWSARYLGAERVLDHRSLVHSLAKS